MANPWWTYPRRRDSYANWTEPHVVTPMECLHAFRRRWYILSLVAVCTVVALWLVHGRSITYKGCQGLLLSGSQGAENAYVNLNGKVSLAMTTGMVTQAVVSSHALQDKIHSEGISAQYSVAQTNTGSLRYPTYTLPTLQVCAQSSDPATVLRVITIATAEVRSVLLHMQKTQHVPSSSLITVHVLARTGPVPAIGKNSQAYLAVFFLGAIFGVALSLWTDRLFSHLTQ